MRNSLTPRTDAEAEDAANYASIAKGWYVHADFARQLETELAAAHSCTETAMDKAKIQAAIDEYECMCAAVGGCGDGNCCIQKPAGMQTNGGCQCHHNRHKAGHMMRAGRQFYAAVVAALNG